MVAASVNKELRNLSFDEAVIRAEVRNLMELDNAPTAVICQQRFVETVVSELETLGIRVPGDVLVAIENSDAKSPVTERCPHLEPKVAFRKRVREAGKMLGLLMAGETPNPPQVLIPLRLVIPDAGHSAIPSEPAASNGVANATPVSAVSEDS